MDERRPLAFSCALRSAEYWLLVASCAACVAGVAWWFIVPLCVAGLSTSALPKYIALYPRARVAGAEREWWGSIALSTLNNIGAAAGAIVLGWVIRWVWW